MFLSCLFFTLPPSFSNTFGTSFIAALASFLPKLLLSALFPNLKPFFKKEPIPLSLCALLRKAALCLSLYLFFRRLPFGATLCLYTLGKSILAGSSSLVARLYLAKKTSTVG